MTRCVPVLLALLACAPPENAVLEVRLDLPSKVDTTGALLSFAHIAIVSSQFAIDLAQPLSVESEAFALAQRDSDGCNVKLSIVASQPTRDRGLLERGKGHGLAMIVWFCPTATACDTRSAPKWLIDFDHALWSGQRSFFEAAPAGSECSHWGVAQSTLPRLQKKTATKQEDFDFSLRVSMCEVLACLDELSQPAEDVGFCNEEGIHPCE